MFPYFNWETSEAPQSSGPGLQQLVGGDTVVKDLVSSSFCVRFKYYQHMKPLISIILVVAVSICVAQQVYPTLDDVVNGCYDYLQSHLCTGTKWGKSFHFYRPALEKYSGM